MGKNHHWVDPSTEGIILKRMTKRLEKLFDKVMDKLENDKELPEPHMIDSIAGLAKATAYVADIKDQIAKTKDHEKRLTKVETLLKDLADNMLEQEDNGAQIITPSATPKKG